MKAGTTSLFEYLATHPAVAPSRPKEPNFFTDSQWWAPDTGDAERLAAYRSLWEWDPAVHEVALEASTSYAKLPTCVGVPERVKSLGDQQFQFIYIMRDPVRRLASHLSHLATRRGGADRVGEPDFEAALEVSRYAMQLDAWTAFWPRNLILPVVYEAMVVDPRSAIARVQDFLNLPAHPLKPGQIQAHNARAAMAADQALAGLLERVPWLEPARRWTPDPVLGIVRRVVGRWASHEVTLTPAQRAQAVNVLRPEVQHIREEWGVDTSLWKSFS